MGRILQFIRAVALGWALAGGALAAEPRDLSTQLEGLRKENKLAGLAVAVMEKGRLTALGASGLRRSDRNLPVTAGDLWHLGSCTKSMTALLAGVLVDAGQLSWETTIPAALPGVPVDAGWQKVTIWDLVTQRSGIGPVWFPESSRVVGHQTPRQRRESLARSLLSRAPAEPVGKFKYSNASYAVLGAILERTADEDYEAMLRRYIFTPLDLKTAGIGLPCAPGKLEQPWGHRRQGARLVPADPASPANQFPPALAPAACVHMSIADFARYASWYSTGEPRLVKPETWTRLQTPPEGSTYAGGIWKTELPGIGGEAVCHTGTLGGFFAVFYAGRDLSCVATFNVEGGGWEWLGDQVLAEILKALR